MFAEHVKHYPSRSGQNSQATAVKNITKPVTKNNFGPSTSLQILVKDYLMKYQKYVTVVKFAQHTWS